MRLFCWCRWGAPLLTVAALAQLPAIAAAAVDNGFSTVVRPTFTGEEIRSQKDLWALEVSLKPMRLIQVPSSNPRSGTKSSELVWYLVYRVVYHPLTRSVDPTDPAPVNVEDPPPRAYFVPKATLVTEGREGQHAVVDGIMPDALQAIEAREGQTLKSSVQIAGPLPKPTPDGAKKPNAEYGVFVFRGVNPRTTKFSVYLAGFSNAYKLGKDESGHEMTLRRTLVVPYKRLADEYDQFEKEIRQSGDPRWIYVPDESPVRGK